MECGYCGAVDPKCGLGAMTHIGMPNLYICNDVGGCSSCYQRQRKVKEAAFKPFFDPAYWDEGEEGDRRDKLGVIISYKDVQTIAAFLPGKYVEKLLSSMDHWNDEVVSVLPTKE